MMLIVVTHASPNTTTDKHHDPQHLWWQWQDCQQSTLETATSIAVASYFAAPHRCPSTAVSKVAQGMSRPIVHHSTATVAQLTSNTCVLAKASAKPVLLPKCHSCSTARGR